jgi:hypothetical protein
MSKTDQAAAYKAATYNNTAFKNRDEAAREFKTKYADQYKSTGYNVEPPTRPTHIPRTYVYSGVPYDVIYNPVYRGYGYMSPTGWMFYDAMADSYMMNRLMNDNYYWYGRPAYAPVHFSGTALLGTIMFIFLVVVVLAVVIRRNS